MKKYWPIVCVISVCVCLLIGNFAYGSEDATAESSPASSPDTGNPEAVVEKAPDVSGKTPTSEQYNPEAVFPSKDEKPEPAESPEVTESPKTVEDSKVTETPPPSPGDRAEVTATLAIVCSDEGVCREKLTGLPFRLLPRSFSNVYKTKNAANDNIAIENVRAFYPLYVFAREDIDLSDPTNPKGWYQVGQSVQGPPVGWMQARDALEWKQALSVSYTHPGTGEEERRRVLMFKDLQDLQQVVDSEVRDQMASFLYKNIEEGKNPAAIVSKEPERFVDITRTFYLLPIVDFQTVEIEGDEARYLQIAAAVPRERGADTLGDPKYREQAQQPGNISGDAAKALGIDLVFVMDMTRSMQPFIDRTKQTLTELARTVASKNVKQKMRFGLVGYRDNASKIPALEFTVKNFTPDLLEVDPFVALLEGEAKATTFGSVDYPEEIYAGIEMGLASAWNEGSLRFIYLVGDASAHEANHEQSTTGKDANVLSLAAKDTNVHILAVHLLDPRMPLDHDLAKKQFSTLSRIEGSEESALVQIQTDDEQSFANVIENSAKVIFDVITQAQSGAVITAGGDTSAGDKDKDVGTVAKQKMDKLMDTALVEYLGREANPPKDIIVWAVDRDLTNPAIRSLNVRVLINKAQLSDLINAIDQVTQAMARAQVSQMQFFEALQGITTQAMKNPEAINVSRRLAYAGLLPAFIQSLPYKSEILSLTDEMYASMTAEQRSGLESSLRAKLQQYRDINEQVDGWVRLNETDPEGSKVYPLILDYLP